MIAVSRAGSAFPSTYNSLNQPHTTFQPVRQVGPTRVAIQKYGQRVQSDFQNKPGKMVVIPVRNRDKYGSSFSDSAMDTAVRQEVEPADFGLPGRQFERPLPKDLVRQLVGVALMRALQRAGVNLPRNNARAALAALQNAQNNPGLIARVAGYVGQSVQSVASGIGSAIVGISNAIASGAGIVAQDGAALGRAALAGGRLLAQGASIAAPYAGQAAGLGMQFIANGIVNGTNAMFKGRAQQIQAQLQQGPPSPRPPRPIDVIDQDPYDQGPAPIEEAPPPLFDPSRPGFVDPNEPVYSVKPLKSPPKVLPIHGANMDLDSFQLPIAANTAQHYIKPEMTDEQFANLIPSLNDDEDSKDAQDDDEDAADDAPDDDEDEPAQFRYVFRRITLNHKGKPVYIQAYDTRKNRPVHLTPKMLKYFDVNVDETDYIPQWEITKYGGIPNLRQLVAEIVDGMQTRRPYKKKRQ